MKVFISWSGEKSREMAEALSKWLKCVLQSCKPWMSTEMDRGTIWFNEIANSLQDAELGIICLTKSNLNKPWILFEAGAILNSLKNTRVCTLLIDLTPADISNPLAQFNHTMAEKKGFYNLIRTLNATLSTPLEPVILKEVFNVYWPSFEEKIQQIKCIDEEKNETIEERDDKDILSEILYSTRSLVKRINEIEYSSGYKSYKDEELNRNTSCIVAHNMSDDNNLPMSYYFHTKPKIRDISKQLDSITCDEFGTIISKLSIEELAELDIHIIPNQNKKKQKLRNMLIDEITSRSVNS